MHGDVTKFCLEIKQAMPYYFKSVDVLDVGSLDVNGTNKSLFENCRYTGIDLVEGKNVDKVCPCHKMEGKFQTIISTEAFEHDMYINLSIQNIMEMLNSGGLFLFTCATKGRQEHGTTRRLPTDSGSSQIEGWCDYYKNVTKSMIEPLVKPYMRHYEFRTVNTDLQFYGVKA